MQMYILSKNLCIRKAILPDGIFFGCNLIKCDLMVFRFSHHLRVLEDLAALLRHRSLHTESECLLTDTATVFTISYHRARLLHELFFFSF